MSKFHHATDKSNINLLEWVDMFYFFLFGFHMSFNKFPPEKFCDCVLELCSFSNSGKKKTTRYFKFIKISEKVNN